MMWIIGTTVVSAFGLLALALARAAALSDQRLEEALATGRERDGWADWQPRVSGRGDRLVRAYSHPVAGERPADRPAAGPARRRPGRRREPPRAGDR